MTDNVVFEKIGNNALKIKGIAMKQGVSRNNNLYTTEWMNNYMTKLVNSPIYFEHVKAPNAVGKVTLTDLTDEGLYYEGEVYDDNTINQIKKGLIKNVSIGYDYLTKEEVEGHNYFPDVHNAELSLVASPGIPGANIMVNESTNGHNMSVSNHIVESVEGNIEEADDKDEEDPKDEEPKEEPVTDDQVTVTKKDNNEEEEATQEEDVKKEEAIDYESKYKELETAYEKILESNQKLRKEMNDKIHEANMHNMESLCKEIDSIVPHEYISNKWNLGAKRFLQDVRSVTYRKRKECAQYGYKN